MSDGEVTENKIRSFRELPDGWHYGEGVPATEVASDGAISLSREAARLAFFETDAFPGIHGEVMFTVYAGTHYLEFTFELNGSVAFLHERDGEELDYQEDLSLSDAMVKMRPV